MNNFNIYDSHILATAQAWLDEISELFIEVYYPRSGGSGTFYLLSTFADFEQLIQQEREGAFFFLLKQKQFPLRGIVDDAFIHQAKLTIADGIDYLITDLAVYPKLLSFYGDGNIHKQLFQDLYDLRGMLVGVGRDPDPNPTYWIEDTRQDRLTAIKKTS